MHAPDFSLKNKLALVTGSTQGLGYAIACAYAASGATVIINGRDPGRVNSAVARIQSAGFQAQAWVQDIANLNDQARAWAMLVEQTGIPDILVNNVGIRIRKSLALSTLEDITTMIQVNLMAAIGLSKLAAKAMANRRPSGGRIISLTSIAGPLARPGDAVYPVAKLGLQGLVHSLAVEFGAYGITSNGIAPGTFATESNQELASDPVNGPVVVGRNPLGRWALPDEIAGAAVFLASASSSYVNGHTLVVDGGFSVTF